MTPILFEKTETAFTSNGIGRLSSAISWYVEEERNGKYELEMQYPVSGVHFDDITLFRIIYAVPAVGEEPQPFEIYEISKPFNGIVTIRAWHISYRLTKITVEPFSAESCSAAMAGIVPHSIDSNPFTFWTDKVVSGSFNLKTPETVRGLLGGQAGSILDVFGTGEYEWDKFTVKLYLHRGSDRGVTIRYRKNLTDLTADEDMSGVYTGIVPYYYSEDYDELVMLQNPIDWSGHQSEYSYNMVVPVDLSSKFENKPTVAQLKTAADSYLANNEGWKLNTNIRVSFLDLADTEEYKDVASLQQVSLCDTVTVIHEDFRVAFKAKVIRTKYNGITGRYDVVEIGMAQKTFDEAITSGIQEDIEQATRGFVTNSEMDSAISDAEGELISVMDAAIANGTALLSGASGGHIKIKTDANGKPQEVLIMSGETEATSKTFGDGI